MAKGTTIANAYVQVIPSMEGVTSELSSGLVPALGGMGSTAGASFAGYFGAAIKKLPAILAGLGIGKAIADFFGSSVETGKEFTANMSQVAATMGVTVGDIQDLTDFAKEMGSTTMFSATQAAEALNYMALAGYSAEESMQALPSVLNLAAAGSMDLARASDMVTDAQSALGLEFEEIEGFVDQLAKTSSTTNTSVEQLGDAILTVGGTAKMMKGGTNELAQVLGLLADNGIKGSEGGTALRNVLLSLSAPTDQAAEELERLGIEAFDSEGNLRSLQEIMADFNVAMEDMTSEERAQALSTIFNKRDLKSVEALLGTTAERWDEVGAAIDGAAGAAQQMADTQMDNLSGDVTYFQSALEGLQLVIFNGVEPGLRSLVQSATEFVGFLSGTFAGAIESLNELFFGTETTVDEFDDTIMGTTGIFDDLSGAFVAVQDIASTVWPTIQEVVGGVLSALGEAFSVAWPLISDIAVTAFEAIRDTVEFVWPVISGIVTGAVNAVKTTIQGLKPIVDFVKGVFDGIKKAMQDPIQTARDIIKGAIDKIKGFFSFKIEWPHIPLPHFSISGSINPLDWFSQGLPSIGVEWYAKGGIIDDATLIGAGEAGPEAIVPLTAPNLAPFAEAVAERIEGGGDTFIFQITADSETTLQSLVSQAQRARIAYGRA